MAANPTPRSSTNRLLQAIEDFGSAGMDSYLEKVDLEHGQTLCEAGGALNHAYFPDSAILSLLTLLENGMAIETAVIGREGAFGIFTALTNRISFNRCTVQRKGSAFRASAEALQSEFSCSERVRDLFIRYSEALFAQVQQTVACHAHHAVKQRMCRWLLMMHDRSDGQDLPCTHEFMADLLGINRKSVTLAARIVQNEGLIAYRRGRMQVVDRSGLEKAACECYTAVNKHFASLFCPNEPVKGGTATCAVRP